MTMDSKGGPLPDEDLMNETKNESAPHLPMKRFLKALLFASCVVCCGIYFSLYHWPSRLPGLAGGSIGVMDESSDAFAVASDGVGNEETGPWLTEVATLMTELYELLQEMKYTKPEAIQYAHHGERGINVTLAKYIGLIPEAITLLQLLPYTVTSPGPYYFYGHQIIPSVTRFSAFGYSNMLLLSTRFADMRDDFTLRASRDPWNGGSGIWTDADVHRKELWTESYLKPWQIALSSSVFDSRLVGSSPAMSSVMVLDLKTRNLWTLGHRAVPPMKTEDNDFEMKGSIDPITYGEYADGQTGLYNRTHLEVYASRPATEALKDYINRFRTLEWVPGYGNGSRELTYGYDSYKALYQKHGWPDSFDGEAFEAARVAWEEHQTKRCKLTDCLWRLERYEDLMEQQRNSTLQLEADLATLQNLNTAVSMEDWDPRKKEYKSRTEAEYLEDIERANYMLQSMEANFRKLTEEEKRLPDWARKELKELEEKYGKAILYGTYPRVECMWTEVDFGGKD